MSRFLSKRFDSLTPYTAGEQPRDTEYIKLNTNESPFPISEKAQEGAKAAISRTNLYPDPECSELHRKIADLVGVSPCEVMATNGSDEILNFAFMAFCDKEKPVVFPDITYGFYKVFAELHGLPYEQIPLTDNFKINVNDYMGINKNIFIANPNAPTGVALSTLQIEEIVRTNPDNIVVIDEAYVDFGGESCIPLIRKYDNLLVTQTFSKSRSMAGARLGFGVGSKELIEDLYKIKYSTNPYNVNSITAALGIGVLEDEATTQKNCREIIKNREYTISELTALGFTVTNSKTNFVFAKSDKIGGLKLYQKLKKRGILVRHFEKDRIYDYNRISIGNLEQMKAFIAAVKDILEV